MPDRISCAALDYRTTDTDRQSVVDITSFGTCQTGYPVPHLTTGPQIRTDNLWWILQVIPPSLQKSTRFLIFPQFYSLYVQTSIQSTTKTETRIIYKRM